MSQPAERPYVGILPEIPWAVFSFCETPSAESHPQYLAVIGPFATVRAAFFMAQHGYNNPLCQTVEQAERLAWGGK